MGRNTSTGGILEAMVLPALNHGGYVWEKQVNIGRRPGGGLHKVDAVIAKNSRKMLLSLKWQQVGGTAEQKVPFEIICLLEAVRSGEFEKAYLVLGGEGWRLREFYTSGGLRNHIEYAPEVEIMTLESFVGKANVGKI